MENLSDDLVRPITERQLKELITAEATEIGLSFDEALRAAQERTFLPGSLLASDIAFLVDLLPYAVSSASAS